ncbi:MAG TPA: hypothetical protein VFD32_15865 [Dehalococcoidia bacterium]|nr:hypothetical protein [Dehalococcoidia bacterium]
MTFELTHDATSAVERDAFATQARAWDHANSERTDAQDDVQGYDFGFGFGGIAEALANSGFHVLSLEPHAATPVPSATGGATVGGGTNPSTRMS